MQWPVMHVFRKEDGKILHFWGTESMMNHLDTVRAVDLFIAKGYLETFVKGVIAKLPPV